MQCADAKEKAVDGLSRSLTGTGWWWGKSSLSLLHFTLQLYTPTNHLNQSEHRKGLLGAYLLCYCLMGSPQSTHMPYFELTREDLDLYPTTRFQFGKQLDAPPKNWLTFAKWTGCARLHQRLYVWHFFTWDILSYCYYRMDKTKLKTKTKWKSHQRIYDIFSKIFIDVTCKCAGTVKTWYTQITLKTSL